MPKKISRKCPIVNIVRKVLQWKLPPSLLFETKEKKNLTVLKSDAGRLGISVFVEQPNENESRKCWTHIDDKISGTYVKIRISFAFKCCNYKAPCIILQYWLCREVMSRNIIIRKHENLVAINRLRKISSRIAANNYTADSRYSITVLHYNDYSVVLKLITSIDFALRKTSMVHDRYYSRYFMVIFLKKKISRHT